MKNHALHRSNLLNSAHYVHRERIVPSQRIECRKEGC